VRLNQIRDFVAVVEAGSMRAASRRIGVSQPAMTKSVRQLEEELQIQLLHRTARGVIATRAGRAFLVRARVVQSELNRVGEDLERLRGEHGGSVAFGIAPAACMLIVPAAMLSFRLRYPRARVRIVEGVNTALLPQVRDETLDFSVGQKPTTKLDPGIRFKPLFRPELVVAGRRGHPLRGAGSLRALGEAAWLMFYPLGVGAVLERAYAAQGLPAPRSTVQCESYATALALLAKTDMLALMIPQLVTEPYANRFLQRIEITERLPAPVIGMYARAGTPLAPAATAMAEAVTAAARQLAKDSTVTASRT
jgi:LysR family transcriptional regulator of abg operon